MLNLFGFLSFPLDLIWGALIFFIYKPGLLNKAWPTLALALLVAGFFLPEPANLAFWMPGGASTIIVATALFLIFATHQKLAPQKFPQLADRNQIQESLMESTSLNERQEKYVQMVQERARTLLRMEEHLTPLNTRFFMISFLVLMATNYPILEFHLLGSETFSKTLASFFEEVSLEPGLFEEQKNRFFDIIYSYSMLFTFINILTAFYFLTSIARRILAYRKIEVSPYGSFTFFRLPDPMIWAFIAFALAFILLSRMAEGALPEYLYVVITNLFFILGSLYTLQGFAIAGLYLVVRMLPVASIFIMIFLLSMVFPAFFIFILVSFLILGLLEFWFNFRKKALHPKIVSNDAF